MRRLVIRTGAIGDVIVSLPAIEFLRSDYLEVWTTARSVPLIRFADRVRSISSTGLDLLGVTDPPFALINELASFDSIVSWYGANRPEFHEAVACLPFEFLPALPIANCPVHATDFYLQQVGAPAGGIPRIPVQVERERHAVAHPFSSTFIDDLASFDLIVSWYGANRPELRPAIGGLPFEFLPALPAANCPVHETDFLLEQVGAPPGGIPRTLIEAEREQYAVVHPFSGSPRKNWPLEQFQRLASKLRIPVRWCAGEEDPPLAGAVHIADLWELAKFLAGAALYIGNDSGITHLAAAVGTPTLAIFVASDPKVWAPRGDHVRVARSFSATQLP
jgi:hypothetical protein